MRTIVAVVLGAALLGPVAPATATPRPDACVAHVTDPLRDLARPGAGEDVLRCLVAALPAERTNSPVVCAVLMTLRVLNWYGIIEIGEDGDLWITVLEWVYDCPPYTR